MRRSSTTGGRLEGGGRRSAGRASTSSAAGAVLPRQSTSAAANSRKSHYNVQIEMSPMSFRGSLMQATTSLFVKDSKDYMDESGLDDMLSDGGGQNNSFMGSYLKGSSLLSGVAKRASVASTIVTRLSSYEHDNDNSDTDSEDSRQRLRKHTQHSRRSNATVDDEPDRTCYCLQRFVELNNKLIQSARFSFLTSLLTVYALFGDDLRLALTHKDLDPIFDVLTIWCLLVFTVEVFANSCAKPGYFLGFFFVLDTVSTATLVLDLTMVSTALFCAVSAEEDDSVRTSRAGRAGARASRTVRIIRLLRLLRLWSRFTQALEERAARARQAARQAAEENAEPGASTEGEEGDAMSMTMTAVNTMMAASSSTGKDDAVTSTPTKSASDDETESRLGKKLADLTTRRVIILVLVMLFFMPLFTTNGLVMDMSDFQHSASLGSGLVYERLRSWCSLREQPADVLPWCLQGFPEQEAGSNVSVTRQRHLRAEYEWHLLTFIHNQRLNTGDVLWSLCWVGMKSSSLIQAAMAGGVDSAAAKQQEANYISEMAGLGQNRYVGDKHTKVVPVEDWDELHSNPRWAFSAQPLAQRTKNALVNPWLETCQGHHGVALSTKISARQPRHCSITRDLRCSEVHYVFPATGTNIEDDHLSIMFAFDRRQQTQMAARLNMVQTLFLILTVGVSSVLFAADADHLLNNPIKRMVQRMEIIKEDPFAAMRLGDQAYRSEEIEQAKLKEKLATKGRFDKFMAKFHRKDSQPVETVILEKTIIRMGGYLIYAFTEVGAPVVSRTIQPSQERVEIEPFMPGVLGDAIIASVGIQDFNTVLTALSENAIQFVNLVAEHVHGQANEYHGVPNMTKGGGEFVLVWRPAPTLTCEGFLTEEMLQGFEEAFERRAREREECANMAIIAMLRTLVAIEKAEVFVQYQNHPAIRGRLPHYKVDLRCALHCGNIAECTIGSTYKLDVAYCSQAVKVPTKLGEAARHYSARLLLTHQMVSFLSEKMQSLCRLIDHVSIVGHKAPFRLFTIDLDLDAVGGVLTNLWDRLPYVKNRFKMRQIRELGKLEKLAESYSVWQEFQNDADLGRMRNVFSADFFLRFSTGYRNYEAGQWRAARDMLVTCHFQSEDLKADEYSLAVHEADWPEDGATVALLHFMQQTDYVPPKDWRGYRRLVTEPVRINRDKKELR
eukprot:TRINITY_DN7672_c0_g1_i5.p1 TRINITY_DN7672_c0_g1~~TRINITY_DN7672_c0_g1_i5.p1  ORF type:complete len:1178 (+),score=265.52 TRINITY_DN7672_c0_g1_i5:139-3672(+)